MEYIFKFTEFIQALHPLIVFLVIFLFGMYVFWRGCAESRKNRSSVFDMFLISGFLSGVVGRSVYIVLEWEQFSSFIWYWIPYEKYGDQVYLFRLLPWRFFSIWDGGLVILAMFVALLLVMTFYSLVIKKWRWKHMFFPIYFSATTMIGSSFVYVGITSGYNAWIYKGLVLIMILAIFFLLFKFIYKIIKDTLTEKYVLGYIGLGIVWISSIYISYLYLTSNLSMTENILVGIFLIWSLVMGVVFVSDLRKAKVRIQSVSTVRTVKTE